MNLPTFEKKKSVYATHIKEQKKSGILKSIKPIKKTCIEKSIKALPDMDVQLREWGII